MYYTSIAIRININVITHVCFNNTIIVIDHYHTTCTPLNIMQYQ